MLKEQGDFNIERQRMTVLMEGDHQLNAKRLGKIAMKCAGREELGLLVYEQCGCEAHHKAVEVLLNARFVDDFLRIKRKLGWCVQMMQSSLASTEQFIQHLQCA